MADLDALCRRLGIEVQLTMPDAPSSAALRYTVTGELGQGRFGRVVSAVDRDMRRTVAVKCLSQDSLLEDDAPEQVRAFLEEAVITGRLEHPNIVPAYDVGVDDDLGVHYTMRRHARRTLRDVIAAEEPPTLARRLDLFVQACRAVAFAHERGVLHTDLKPEHVLIGAQSEVQVADWGLAIVLGESSQARLQLMGGTPRYMSPEQITELPERLDARTDVWALGVILYELLTGAPPFDGSDEDEVFDAILSDALVRPSRRSPSRGIPEALDRACASALVKARALRTTSVVDLLGEIEAFLDDRREAARVRQVVARARDDAEAGQRRGAFGEATDALLRGLEVAPEDSTLLEAAAGLYWRVFAEVYEGRTAGPAGAARGWLASLAAAALTQIVAMAPSDVGDDEADGDPWLRAVRRLARGQRPEAEGPSALAALVRRLERLASVGLFEALASPELLPIAEACRDVTCRPGGVLFEAGDLGDTLYVVAAGRLEVVQGDTVLTTLEPGDAFGEIAVFGAHRRTATVRSASESRCLALEASALARLVTERGEIGLALLNVLSRRLERATEREASLRAAAQK